MLSKKPAAAPRPPRQLAVGVGDVNMRLDRFIRAQMPALPQSLIQRLVRRRAITVAEPGQPLRKGTVSERVRDGMIVNVPQDVDASVAKPTRRAVRVVMNMIAYLPPRTPKRSDS